MAETAILSTVQLTVYCIIRFASRWRSTACTCVWSVPRA